MAGAHRIRSVRWEAAVRSQEDGFAVRQLIREEGCEFLLPLLQKAFDQACPDDEVAHVPKLEIRLKLARHGQFPRDEAESVLSQVLGQLGVFRRREKAAKQGSFPPRRAIEESRMEALLRYLETGILPWELQGLQPHEAAAELEAAAAAAPSRVMDNIVAARMGAAGWMRFLSLLPPIGERLLPDMIASRGDLNMLTLMRALVERGDMYLPHAALLRFFSAVAETATTQRSPRSMSAVALTPHEREMATLFAATLPEPLMRLMLSAILPINAVEAGSPTRRGAAGSASGLLERPERARKTPVAPPALEPVAEAEGFSQSAADARASVLHHSSASALTVDGTSVATSGTVIELSEPFETGSPSRVKGEKEALPVFPPVEGGAFAERECTVDMSQTLHGDEGPAPSGEYRTAARNRFVAGDIFPLLVRNAGLVLLIPFIPRFLENTGSMTADALTVPFDALPRAAALLNFLATGEQCLHEFELPLVKVLLGIDPWTPVPVAEEELEERDREEARALLQAVVSYWTGLKGTSAEGFRSSFLRRTGLLREEDGAWRLNVERKSYDILLEHLPWAISVAKLPWMKKPVLVQW